MPQATRLVANVPIAIGPGNNQTINTLLDPLDLSMAKLIEVLLTLTAIQTVIGSTLGVKFQMATYVDPAGNQVWDTRGYFSLVPGNQAASAASPYQEGMNISQDVDLQASERMYRPTGSNGGTELSPGTVRDGDFPAYLREGLLHTRQPNARIQFVVSDAAASAGYTGNVLVYAHMWDW
jgi:hypothetical protein